MTGITMGVILQPDYAAAALTLIIAVLSFSSLQKLVVNSRAQQRRQDGRIYEDEDGAASEDSIARFSNKVQFIIIFAINISAIVLAGAEAIFTAVQNGFAIAGSDMPLLGIYLLVPAWVSFYRRALGGVIVKLTSPDIPAFATFYGGSRSGSC